MMNQYGHTALYLACSNGNISTEIISKMLELGGRELLMMEVQQYGVSLSLYMACEKKMLQLK